MCIRDSPDVETYLETKKIIEEVDKAEVKDDAKVIHYSGGTVKLGSD